MRKTLTILFFIAIAIHTNGQYPSMSDYIIQSVSTTTFQYDNCGINYTCQQNQEKTVTEVPPWIIPGSWRSYFFVDGRKTYIWSSPASIINSSSIDLKNNAVGPFNATYPYILDWGYSATNPVQNWKRNYHAIYTAQYINHPTQGPVSIGFCHGENKNETLEGDCYSTPSNKKFQNTIQSSMTINCSNHNTWSGGSPYIDGWDAYNGVLSAVWVPNNQQTNWGQQFFSNELGPIVWPSMAYVTTAGIKTTNGIRHPSSIIYNNYIYIYYVEEGVYQNLTSHEEGREGGIKLVRVQKDLALNPGSYETYYKDLNTGNVTWNPALPSGFTKDNMLQYVTVKGPKSTDVLGDNAVTSAVNRFSVAKVRNTNYFIGVEEFRLWPTETYSLAIRYSDNLLDWSPRQVVYSVNGWENGQLHYPIFLDASGWSNTEVDNDDFYILGTENYAKKLVNQKRIYKYSPPPPPPPCVPTPEQPCVEERTKKNVDNELPENIVFRVMPNPVSGNMSVRISTPGPKRISLNLYSSEGKLIRKFTKETISGSIIRTYDVSAFASGLYYLEMNMGTGHFFKKVIKL